MTSHHGQMLDLNKMHHENDHPNLKVDTLSIQNNTKLKSYMVEFSSGKFLSAPMGIWTHDLEIWSPTLYQGAKRVRLFLQQKSKYINAIA